MEHDQMILSLRPRVERLALNLTRMNSIPNDMIYDLTQSGMEAVIRASRTFDPSKGYPFGAYAYKCARREMVRVVKKERDILRRQVELPQELEDGTKLEDYSIEMPTMQMFELDLDYGHLWRMLRSQLTQREFDILLMRLRGMNNSEIAKRLGVSRQRIHQILQGLRQKASLLLELRHSAA